jgi:hypothetical protein
MQWMVLLSIESVRWEIFGDTCKYQHISKKIFGDRCVGSNCMDMTVARPIT